MKHFDIIGLDDNMQPRLSVEVMTLIASHQIFSGGLRHHEIIRPFLPEGYRWIDIKVPLDDVFEQYIPHEKVVIFASGDPLFFGFANTLRNRLPEADIKLFPYFNSLQLLAHQLVMPYHDMKVVSLTGRPWHDLDRTLIRGVSKIGVLTDQTHTPATIAQRMLEYGYNNYIMYVGEHLGNVEKQNVRTFRLEAATTNTFSTPNCLILVKTSQNHTRPFGIPDFFFEHLEGREKMITKMPIRLLTLSMLELRSRQTFWDIGFCTGSVSIEAKLQFPHLYITAFEIREEGRRLMETNSRRFGTPGIDTIIGDFCKTDLSTLNAPDAVFIGGHGGNLTEMMQHIAGKLKADGVVVFNSVSEESKAIFAEAAQLADMQIQKEISMKVDDHNTITILKAIRNLG